MPIEIREYNQEDSSAEDVQSIKDSVFQLDDITLHFKELPIQTPYSVAVTFDEIEKYIEEDGSIDGLVVDLTTSQRPAAKARKEINARFKRLDSSLAHVAFYTGQNFLLNTAIRFVIAGAKLTSFSVSSTKEEALKELSNARRQ